MDTLARRQGGFTLIELLVVLAIVATLLTIAVPRYFDSLDHARETTLRQSLSVMRKAIDQYHGDRGRYPGNLQELVTARYLRNVPPDPVTGAADQWITEFGGEAGQAGIRDVRSAAPGTGRDGTAYASG